METDTGSALIIANTRTLCSLKAESPRRRRRRKRQIIIIRRHRIIKEDEGGQAHIFTEYHGEDCCWLHT
ncbi:hypothetical protein JG687_00013829 [Phytophthora cactorum]|uniref:Uncharacterized protein n=1 Tax=Phytophthora cactorum TaxID=29920 RepID=A0A8T1TZ94_9STRA|nr:hypothetical protein JG687_00013829 [Phytophthora cactorum]